MLIKIRRDTSVYQKYRCKGSLSVASVMETTRLLADTTVFGQEYEGPCIARFSLWLY